MKIKKQRIWLLGLVTGLLLLGAVLFCATFERNALQAKPASSSQKNSTRGTARQLNFYLQKRTSNGGTGINGIKFQLEVKKADDTWEKVKGSDGKVSVFTTRENGRIQLLEEQLQDLEERYGSGPYRFYETETPSADYWPAEVSDEFEIGKSETWTKEMTMYNFYCGTFTLEAKVSGTSMPLSGVKLVAQYSSTGSTYYDVEDVEGVPSEFVTNSEGKVTLTTDQIVKITDKYPNAKYFRLQVKDVPEGYQLVKVSASTSIHSTTKSLSPEKGTCSIPTTRSLVLQKNDQMTYEPLPEVEFELQVSPQKDADWERVDESKISFPLVTDSKGQVVLSESELAALENHYGAAARYRFKETKELVGYYPLDEQSVSDSFQISATTVTPTKLSMSNEPLPEQLVLQKSDRTTNKCLKGADFIVQKRVGENWANVDDFQRTTNDSGEIILTKADLTNLGEGTFRFKETKAPAGYKEPNEDKSISDAFVVSTGGYVSTGYLTMDNMPIETGELYLDRGLITTGFLADFDSHSGKGYATKMDGKYGWIRSNDTFNTRYMLKPTVPEGGINYKNVKVRVTAEVLGGNGYSDFADPAKDPLQNVTFEIFGGVNPSKLETEYDPVNKIVKATQEFEFGDGDAQGGFSQITISAKVGSSFYGTTLPLKYTIQILSAVDPTTGNEIRFDEDEQAERYMLDLPIPIPNKTLTVTSKLNMVPVVAGFKGFTDNYVKKTLLDKLVDSNINPEAKVASIGYGWQTIALEGRKSSSPRNLGLAVPKGNNQFQITLEQSVLATLNNQTQKPVTLGPSGDLPWIDVFSFGIPGTEFGDPIGQYGTYSDYNRSLLATDYYFFSDSIASGTVNYELRQNNQGELTAAVKAPTYFEGEDGYVDTYRLFGVGSYLVYPARAAAIKTRTESDVIQQDYTIGIKDSSYTDNDGEVLEVPVPTGSGKNTTWTEKFDENKPKEPIEDRYFILEKKDKNGGFLLPGAEFILEYQDGSEWKTVDLPGFTLFESDKNGQVVLNAQQLDQLFEAYSNGKESVQFRFKETKAPAGYRDPADYEKKLYSTIISLKKTEITPNRDVIENLQTAQSQGFVLRKEGENAVGTLVGLPGAVFELYFGTPKDANSSQDSDYDWQLVELTKVFGLSQEEVNKKLVSDANGEIHLTESELQKLANHSDYGPGRYRFKEIVAPKDYALPEGDEAFTKSFKLTKEDVLPNEITMNNKRNGWTQNGGQKSYSAYGYEVEKNGQPMFSKIGTTWAEPLSLASLEKNAKPYSSEPVKDGYGKVLRGEEIVVGSSQVATYYSYPEYNKKYIENWQPKEAEMLQLWNPAEGKLVEAGYSYFEEIEQVGEVSEILYGVKKNKRYTNQELNKAREVDYTWYSLESVPENEIVSAVKGKITNFKANYRETHEQIMQTRWNLYTKRIADGKPGNTDSGVSGLMYNDRSSYYMTYTRSKIIYENFDENASVGEQEKVLDWENTEYQPALYKIGEWYNSSAKNNKQPHSPLASFGDTLMILPYYQPTVEKIAVNPNDKSEQKEFTLDSMLEFQLKVTFPEPRPGTRTMPFDFSLVDNVKQPDDKTDRFLYQKNSSTLNTLPIEDPDMTSLIPQERYHYLAWENLKGSYEDSNEYVLSFQAYPTEANKILTNEFTLSASFYGNRQASTDVMITSPTSAGGIFKTTDTPVIEKATESNKPPIKYSITLRNYLEDVTLKGVKVFDLLPANGDKRGSKFDGGYSLEKMTAERMDGTPFNDEEIKYFYTTDTLEPMDPEKEITANNAFDRADWREFKDITDAEKKKVTAIYVTMPDLPSRMAYNLSLEIVPDNNDVGNRYFNVARFGFLASDINGNELPDETFTFPVETVVVNRSIAGTVWQDLDYTGIMEKEEPRIEKVPVKLYQTSKGQLKEVTETMTDEKGQYRFDGVASGYYKVGFQLPEPFANFLVTKTNVLGDPLRTNKVSQSLVTEDGYHLTQDDVQVPFVEYEKNNEGKEIKPKAEIKIEGINMGILAEPNLTVLKEVTRKNDEGKYIDINGGKVKVGEKIRYTITVTNPVKDSYIKDIRIQDTLPAGLEYVDGSLMLAQTPPNEDSQLDPSKYQFSKNEETGRWELKTESLGDLTSDTDEIKLYFDVKVTKSAEGQKLVNIATATGALPPDLSYEDESQVDNHAINTPEPSIKKTVDWKGKDDGVSLKQGDEFTYTLTVRNEAGASTWREVVVSDILNGLMGDPYGSVAYLTYSYRSTTLDGEPIDDQLIWTDEDKKLSLSLGDFEGSETGTERIIKFRVKLGQLPPPDKDGKVRIINKATAIGKGINEENVEVDYSIEDTNKFELDKGVTQIKLNVRQVILDPSDELVVPSKGYLEVKQHEKAEKVVSQGTTTLQIKSAKEEKVDPDPVITEMFTPAYVRIFDKVETLVPNLAIVPEYYEYVGSIVSTDSTKLAEEHVVSKIDAKKPILSVEGQEEYWVSLYLKPKFEKDETSPRPYSWDYATNKFGTLSFEEQEKNKKSIAE